MMGEYAMAPRVLAKSPYGGIGRRGQVISSEDVKQRLQAVLGFR